MTALQQYESYTQAKALGSALHIAFQVNVHDISFAASNKQRCEAFPLPDALDATSDGFACQASLPDM